MNRNTKKGFTIVELIIVIAVIGILAAVLIPTFSGLIRNSQEAKDTALVRNLNVLLKMDNTKHESMRSVVEALDKQGADITKLTAAITENRILWDSEADLFAYLNKGTDGKETISYIPDFDGTPLETKYKYWIVSDNKADVDSKDYSVYWRGEGMPELTVYTGFDCGKAKFGKIIYTSDKQQDVSLYINGGDLDVSAENKGTQRLYGYVATATIATGNDCLYVHGTIANARVTAGKVVADGGLVMVAAAESGVTVVGQNGGIVAKTADAGTLPDTVKLSTDAEKSAYALEIGTGAELASFRDMVNSGMTYAGLTVKLTADIDLSSHGNWNPIGNRYALNGTSVVDTTKEDGKEYRKAFKGTFDGQGHTISGLFINSNAENYKAPKAAPKDGIKNTSSYAALFGYVDNAIVKNFTVNGLVSGCDVAGVIGILGDNCTVDRVVSNVDVGGKTGENEEALLRGKAGGIINMTKGNGSKITNCTNNGDVRSDKGTNGENRGDYVGGIIALIQHDGITISNCKNTGAVTTKDYHAGGIVGGDAGDRTENGTSFTVTIIGCENKGEITSTDGKGGHWAGAIIGLCGTNSYVKIQECSNVNAVISPSTKAYDKDELVGLVTSDGKIEGVTKKNDQ